MSIEAEQSVLGALLLKNDALDSIPDLLPEHFYREDHREIFNELRKQIAANKRADVLTVGVALRGSNHDVMGYLQQIENSTPSSSGVIRYAEMIINSAVKRSLVALSNEIGDIIAITPESSVCVDLIAAKVERLAQRKTEDEPEKLSQSLIGYTDILQSRLAGDIKPISSGYPHLDASLGGGFDRGTLAIIAGRPAMGKTALALGIARNVSWWGSALFLSMEMSKTQVTDRNISALGEIPLSFLRTPVEDSPYWENLTNAFSRAERLNLFIDEQTSLNLIQIRAKARKIKRKNNLDLLVVDQLSFLRGAESKSPWDQVGEYTRGLIQIAKELNVAVILLCQLNRECEKRSDKRPQMSDLAQSGSIEQDASTIILLYRDVVYNENSADKNIAELNITKQRQGSIGRVGLEYIGDQTNFKCPPYYWHPRAELDGKRSNGKLISML